MKALKIKKPQKTYKNLEEARVFRSLGRLPKDGKYPCVHCDGYGKITSLSFQPGLGEHAFMNQITRSKQRKPCALANGISLVGVVLAQVVG